jgi:hypothetical protein
VRHQKSTRLKAFAFGIKEDEDSLSLGILYKPGISRLKGPEPFFSDSHCVLQAAAALVVQVIGLTADPNLQRKSARVLWF